MGCRSFRVGRAYRGARESPLGPQRERLDLALGFRDIDLTQASKDVQGNIPALVAGKEQGFVTDSAEPLLAGSGKFGQLAAIETLLHFP
jgi:hypothetical protein